MLWLILLVWLGVCRFAETAPELVCEAPEYHFPPTANTGEVHHVFVLRNAGDEPLQIRSVQPDCGCLLVQTPPTEIEAGGEIELAVRFHLEGRRGAQRRRITVFSNAPNLPCLTLYLVGEVLAEVFVQPEHLLWGNISGEKEEQREAIVEFDAAHAAVVQAVDCAQPGFEAEVFPEIVGQRYRLVFRTVPPLAPARFEFPVVIRTDHPRRPELALKMSGRVVEEVFAIPDEIVVSRQNDGAAVLILLRALDDAKFELHEVVPPLPEVVVRQRPLKGGVRVELRGLRAVPELDGQCVVFKIARPEVVELKVPVRVREE